MRKHVHTCTLASTDEMSCSHLINGNPGGSQPGWLSWGLSRFIWFWQGHLKVETYFRCSVPWRSGVLGWTPSPSDANKQKKLWEVLWDKFLIMLCLGSMQGGRNKQEMAPAVSWPSGCTKSCIRPHYRELTLRILSTERLAEQLSSASRKHNDSSRKHNESSWKHNDSSWKHNDS